MKLRLPIPQSCIDYLVEAVLIKKRCTMDDLQIFCDWGRKQPNVHGEITPDNPTGEWWKRFTDENSNTKFYVVGRGDIPINILKKGQIPYGKEVLESLSLQLVRFLLEAS